MKLKTFQQIKEDVVLERLEHFEGNKTRTAKSLGISLKGLYNIIKILITKNRLSKGKYKYEFGKSEDSMFPTNRERINHKDYMANKWPAKK